MKNNPIRMVIGEKVKVKLNSDDNWYIGTVLNEPRKMWVRLDNYPVNDFIADESCIEKWQMLI